jgi:hypothetical protein
LIRENSKTKARAKTTRRQAVIAESKDNNGRGPTNDPTNHEDFFKPEEDEEENVGLDPTAVVDLATAQVHSVSCNFGCKFKTAKLTIKLLQITCNIYVTLTERIDCSTSSINLAQKLFIH